MFKSYPMISFQSVKLKKNILIILLLLPILYTCSKQEQIGSKDYTAEIQSPDNQLTVQLTVKDGLPSYEADYMGKPILTASRLGVQFNKVDLTKDLTVDAVETNNYDVTWTQPWGEQKQIRDHHTEHIMYMTGKNGEKMNIIFRVFDDGIGFRYEWPEQENLQDFIITKEVSEFNLAGDHTSWWIKAYQLNRYEHLYQESKVSEIDTVHTPFTMKTDEGLYLSIHEAALTDFASMTLANNGKNSLEADLVPWVNGDKVRGSAPHQSPWRTIALGETAGELMTNYLVLNLNEPSKIEDPSWTKPAKYTGIWWDMHLGTKTWGSGDNHGATTEYTKELMDFTAKHDFYGVLVEGWNIGWDGSWFENGDVFSFTDSYPDFDLEEVTEYADSLGVKLIGHHETSAGISNY